MTSTPSSGAFAPRRIAVVGDGAVADDVARRLRESAAGQVVRVPPPDPASGDTTWRDGVAESPDATTIATSAVTGTDPGADLTGFLDRWAAAPGSAAVVGVFETPARERAFVAAARTVTPDLPVAIATRRRADVPDRTVGVETTVPRDRLFRAALDRAGVLAVDSVTELVDVGTTLAGLPVPPADGLGVVTNAGGPGVMATDAVAGTRLAVASLGDDATAALDDLVPEAGSIRNPVDILADASLDRFRESLAAVLADDAVGGAVVLSAPSALFDFVDLADIVVDVQQDRGKPVATALMGGASVRPAARRLAAAGVPNFFDPARAVRSLGALADYRAVRDRTGDSSAAAIAVDEGRVDLALAERSGRALLDAYGVPTTSAPVPDAIPTVLAAGRDDEFGPVVAFRLADEAVPVVDDVAVRLAPVSRTEADRMLDDLDTAPILRGARGYDPVDRASLVDVVHRVSHLVAERPSVDALELAPLYAGPDGAWAADPLLSVDRG